jgi:predicted transcriptional regulator
MFRFRTFLVYLLTVTIVFVGILAFQAYSDKNSSYPAHAASNENIISIERFQVTAIKAGLATAVEGAVFAKGTSENVESLQIAASMELDPLDWAGIAFNLPAGWKIYDMNSSFSLDHAAAQNPTNYDFVHTWTTPEPNEKWPTIVEIANAKTNNYTPFGAGRGTIIIDLVPIKRLDEQTSVNFSVSVGSQIRNGYRVSGTDFIEVDISGKANKE